VQSGSCTPGIQTNTLPPLPGIVRDGCILGSCEKFVERCFSFLKDRKVVSSGNSVQNLGGNMIRPDSDYNAESSRSIWQEGVASSFSGCGAKKCGRCVAPVRRIMPPPFLDRGE
jgi:hypothetical protein